MNRWNKPPLSWGAEESLGTSLAISLAAALVIPLWPGWPFILAVLSLPLAWIGHR